MPARRIIAVLVLVLTLGLQWAALQSVAWISMIIRYSQSATLHEALVQTFDGRHPCPLCLIVAEGKKSEQKNRQPQLTFPKCDVLCEVPVTFLFREAPPNRFELCDLVGATRFEQPPSPPPRLV